MLDGTGPAGAVLGRQGRDYFRRHYTWPVVEQKYRDLFDRLKRDADAGGDGAAARLARAAPADAAAGARGASTPLPAGPVIR